MDILQEVYFGKAPIAPLQKQLSKFRSKLRGKPITSITNIDPDVVKFNRMCEQFFGFSRFSLYIQPNNIPNAYAFSVTTFFTDEEKKRIVNALISTPTGFKYDKAFSNVGIVLAIHSGLLDADYASDEEIMATLLHEIGHGFFEAVTTPIEEPVSIVKRLAGLLQTANSYALDRVKNGKDTNEKEIDKDISAFDRVSSYLRDSFNNIKNKIIVKEAMEDNMKKSRIAYTNEKFADTFAAMYGYGEEAHSIDIKIFQHVYKDVFGVKQYSHLQEVFKMYKLYLKDLLAYTLNIQDEHPAELARIKTTADYIRKELSKEALDPKLKRELLGELDKVNELIRQYMEFPKDEDSMRILRLYHIKLYEKFGGDRREQDTDNNALFDAIDNRYNKLNDK